MKILDFFEQTILIYYPMELDESSIEYYDTIEFQRRLNLISKNYENREIIDLLIIKLNELLKSEVYLNEMGSNFPSYIVQINLVNSHNKKHIVCIYLSFLIPFYSIFEYILSKSNNNYILKNFGEEVTYFKEIDKIINSMFCYNPFPKWAYFTSDEDMVLKKESKYFKAFFDDCVRINDF